MIKKYYFLLLFFSLNSHCFQTIDSALSHAKTLPEFPENSAPNWVYPEYDKQYKKLAPSLFSIFVPNESLIAQKLTKQIEKRASKTQEYALKIVCKPDTKIALWTEARAAFHSLIRGISWLEQNQYIDNNFKILKDDFYIIFNSNMINRGAYNLETLLLILQLMQQNPEKVFYVRGKQETNYKWTNGTLKTELQTRLSRKRSSSIPLESELQTFFNSLPESIFITNSQQQTKYIQISFSGSEFAIDKTDYCSLLEKRDPIGVKKMLKKDLAASPDQSIDIIAIIRAKDWRKSPKIVSGLALIGHQHASTAWGMLSSPIESHQKLISFYNDSFALLTIKEPLAKSTIQVVNRDIRNKSDFKISQKYNLQSGHQVLKDAKHAQSKIIAVGSSMALERGVPVMGQRTKRGMSVALHNQNKKHELDEHMLRSIVYNDDYVPQRTRGNINRLLEKNKTNLILLPVGSPTLGAYLDYIKNSKVLVLFPITGGPQFRDPELKGLVHFRATYKDEVTALVKYMVTEKAARKFAFFYQDDAYGKGPLQAAHQELEQLGITNWTDVPYQRNSVDYKKQAQKIKEAQPDTIGLFSTAQATRELIRQIGVDFLSNRQLFGISFLGEESFRRFLKKHGLTILFGAVVPNPRTSKLPIVQEYRKQMDELGYPYDIFSLEAYITTRIFIDALKKIKPPYTKEKILEQLESYNNYNFKGLNLTFNPERRDLTPFVWLETGDTKDWQKKEIKSVKTRVRKEDDAGSLDTSRSKQLSPRSTGPTSQSMAS